MRGTAQCLGEIWSEVSTAILQAPVKCCCGASQWLAVRLCLGLNLAAGSGARGVDGWVEGFRVALAMESGVLVRKTRAVKSLLGHSVTGSIPKAWFLSINHFSVCLWHNGTAGGSRSTLAR